MHQVPSSMHWPICNFSWFFLLQWTLNSVVAFSTEWACVTPFTMAKWRLSFFLMAGTRLGDKPCERSKCLLLDRGVDSMPVLLFGVNTEPTLPLQLLQLLCFSRFDRTMRFWVAKRRLFSLTFSSAIRAIFLLAEVRFFRFVLLLCRHKCGSFTISFAVDRVV